jgi:hypothetical protein
MNAIGRKISPELRQIIRSVGNEFPTDNVLVDAILSKTGNRALDVAKGAGIGGALTGGLAAFQGSDEGLMADYIDAQFADPRRKI